MAQYMQTDGQADQSQIIRELVTRWNDGELDITNDQAEKLAYLAAQYGFDFDSESNPIGKFAFDFANTATFGLVPNSWRPETVGEKWHGESEADKIAGGIGTVGGIFTGVGAAYKLGGGAVRGVGKMFGRGGAAATGGVDSGALVASGRGLQAMGQGAVTHPGLLASNTGLTTAVSRAKAMSARERATNLAATMYNQGRNFTNQVAGMTFPMGAGRSFAPNWRNIGLAGAGLYGGKQVYDYMTGPSQEELMYGNESDMYGQQLLY